MPENILESALDNILKNYSDSYLDRYRAGDGNGGSRNRGIR